MSDFHGPNAAYVLELYEKYLQAPDSVDAHTRAFFASWSPPSENGAAAADGASPAVAAPPAASLNKAAAVVSFAQAIRLYGHLDARLDPLGSDAPSDPELSPEFHGVTYAEMRELPASLVGGPISERSASAYDAIRELQAVYCATIGYDNDHIRVAEERAWLREAAESRRYRFQGKPEEAHRLLGRLTQVEAFEQFLQKTFPTKYRFSVEGLDTMVPILDEIIQRSSNTGMSVIAIAMAHRGRLNVLAHVMGKPYEQILSEFRDDLLEDVIGLTQGDVKYHMAYKQVVGKNINGEDMVITMPPNPSHLEAVNPVAVGMARAAGTRVDQPGKAVFNPDRTMQILIHGDAAFPGQGIVAETFNLSQLPGYWTGGTIHIIANNQIGFTTNPREGRSTLYASDLAKGFKAPIIHVNADDPAACIEVARIAFAYQDIFEKDIVIDLIGYRRYGHNELDEPGFTQPIVYHVVRQHPTVREIMTKQLVNDGVMSADDAAKLVTEYTERLQHIYDTLPPVGTFYDPPPTPPAGIAGAVDTAVSMERLKAINSALGDIPPSFTFYSPRFEKTIRSRREAFDNTSAKVIDWATAEELAFATILADGTAIRMTGQDVERGTFSHRHAVLTDRESGEKYVPLQSFPQARASFEIYNSALSEAAALGFEYGYNVQEPDRLVLWEAQYGDFINGAQTIIDEFIVSAREKWGQTPSLVLTLPHAYEGAGPDHSSARLERFLQLSAKMNIRVAYPTTASQYFHLLRRQAKLLREDPLPLIIMSPKSLLRNPAVMSSADELAHGRWQPVIDDPAANHEVVKRLILCSGKFYYDLIGSELRAQMPEVAIVRVEQLYPFPVRYLEPVIRRYSNVETLVWAQEEPKNMGAWEFMSWRLEKMLAANGGGLKVNYVGRRRSSTPAEGSKALFYKNQSLVIEAVFTHQFNHKQTASKDAQDE